LVKNGHGIKEVLRRSQFVVGLARSARGLRTDAESFVWRIQRHKCITHYLSDHQVRKLQLAASGNILSGWLNTDIHLTCSAIVYLDATRSFPFPDGTLDYIFAEHMIEHLDFPSAHFMLLECFRALKPGGRVRIATPDISSIVALHCQEKTAVQKNYLDWAVARFLPEVTECRDVFVINNFFRSWGHQFLYDEATLTHALHSAGFNDVKSFRPGASDDPLLQGLEAHGKEIGSQEVNDFETIVVEGHK
jgi:predicted SAM-dependent methyltransferase